MQYARENGVMNMQFAHSLSQKDVAIDASERRNRQWFALSVATRHEKKVSSQLEQKGYETFLPLYRRQHRYARRIREFQLPLFPGYLFCRIDPGLRLPVLTTPGVFNFLGVGNIPNPVADEEIKALQIAVRAAFPMEPYNYWQTGQKGRIVSGPLSGLEGIVVESSKPLRLILSITLIQRSVLLEIDADCVVAEAGQSTREIACATR
jgi:transcription antitermination factor NusG